MLLPLNKDSALLGYVGPQTNGHIRVIHKDLRQTEFDPKGATGQFKFDDKGRLILHGQSATHLVDPDSNFTIEEMTEAASQDATFVPSVAFLGTLVDGGAKRFKTFDYDWDALELSDPGYSGPTDAVLLPSKDHVAITIARTPHMAVFDLNTGATTLVNLAGRQYSANAVVREDRLWLTNYDVLCRVDPDNLEVSCSSQLQKPIKDGQYGLATSAFVGEPLYVEEIEAWLIPRPYSGDILRVDPETLEPDGYIPCGGRPYSIVACDCGTLIILDHPFDRYQLSHTNKLKPL